MNIHSMTSPRTFVAVTALALALSIGGCKSSTPAPATDDATLTSAVQSKLSADNALSTESIQSSVQNGIVTLNGTVSNDAARSLAASDVSQIPGIKTVVNNLTVAAPAPVATAPAPAPVPTPAPAKKVKTPAPKPVVAPSRPAPIERPQPVAQVPVAPTPAPAPAPAPPPPPAFRNVTIPAGTTIPVRINQTLDSASTQQGQSFTGTVATDIMADGLVAIRQGSAVTGRVTAVQEAAHYKGNSLLTVELVSISRNGDSLAVSTQPYSVEGKGRGKNTAAKVGGGAAIGAIIGAIAGGGKGAAIGSAAGAGVGAGANTITRGEQVRIPAESLVNFQITNTLAVRASTSSTLSTTGSHSNRRPMTPAPDASTGDQQPQ
ncbi:BON domain-containing protein [Edaphobacter flagellatus]|uniref:BON domain-containing protein n=1 Tax=Edaphobacter flagellatus TaxID=1933044 RepID=UPI0028C400E4|nr:BON domain-containing protein [Edaphobacter flagellatus]